MDEDEEKLTDDPEILALLAFEPVVRKCKRHDAPRPFKLRKTNQLREQGFRWQRLGRVQQFELCTL